MNRVFLDTVGLLALWDPSDQWHAAARQAMDRLLLGPCQWITTSYVMLECGHAAARSRYRDTVVQTREELEGFGNLVVPSEADEREAWAAYRAGEAGIVDHVSFVAMRRLGLRQAFSNDRHFVAAGFEILF